MKLNSKNSDTEIGLQEIDLNSIEKNILQNLLLKLKYIKIFLKTYEWLYLNPSPAQAELKHGPDPKFLNCFLQKKSTKTRPESNFFIHISKLKKKLF